MSIKLEGGGGKALMAWSLVEEVFCGFPNREGSPLLDTPLEGESYIVVYLRGKFCDS